LKLVHENKKGKRTKTKVYINDDYDDDEDDETYVIENELKAYREARKARLYKKKLRRRRIITLIAVIVLSVVICLDWNLAPSALAERFQNFLGEFGRSKYPVQFDEGLTKAAVPVGPNVGVLTDTSFILYAHNGEKLASRPHGFNSPAAVSGGGRALIYDRGGRQFKIETRFGEPFSKTAAYPITSATMGSKGNFAVITQAENYLSELTVYSSSYKAVFRWNSTKGRILAAALSPDGKKLAAIVTGARNGTIFSDIYIFGLDSEKPLAVKQYTGDFLYSIRFKDNKRIAAVGDQKSVFLYTSGEQKSEYDYGGKELIASVNLDGPTVLAFRADSEKTNIVSLDGEGKTLGSAKINGALTSVSVNSNYIVALTDGKIFTSKSNLKEISETSVPVGALSAMAIKKHIFLVGIQSVERYDVK